MTAQQTGILVQHVSAFTGGISNSGTISSGGSGIALTSSVSNFAGGITNSGKITVSGNANGISDFAATFAGGISNSGIISTNNDAIHVDTVASIAGDISNGGTITAPHAVLFFERVSTFTGNIVNSGSIIGATNGAIDVQTVALFAGSIINSAGGVITAASSTSIRVHSVSTFTGAIVNGGTVNAPNGHDGISLNNISTFAGPVTNNGTISVGGKGIFGCNIALFGNPTAGGGIVNAGTISSVGGTGVLLQQVKTFAGGITNSGTISAGGHVGISINSVSTFSGGISNGGTISGGNDAILVHNVSTFTGGISNSGALSGGPTDVNVRNVSTFAGGIVNANSGVITGRWAIGVTTAVSFGTNSAGGGIVNSGTLVATANGAIFVERVSTFLGGITNSGTVTAGISGIFVQNVPTFTGNISNFGTITAGTGIDITNAVTFAGGAAIVNTGTITGSSSAIDVSGATSPVTIDQNGGLISGAIKLSANADVLNVTGGTIAGNIVGQGSSNTVNFAPGTGNTFTYGPGFGFSTINQVNVNSGMVVLNGANSATNVTINAGTLQIGDVANPGATLTVTNPVQVFGTLSGHGTLTGGAIVEAGGHLSPGGSVGTLTISGSLTFNAGSVFGIELSPTAHSQTNVTGVPGTVTINGGNVVLNPQLGTYSASTFAILTSTGTLTGTFNPVVGFAGTFTLPNATLSYDPNDVFLSYDKSVNTLTLPAGATINQSDVAGGINSFIAAGGTPPAPFQGLANLTGNALLAALDQLSGEAATDAAKGAFQLGDQFLVLMLDPFVDGRIGPIGVGGTAPGLAPEREAAFPPDIALAYNSVLKAPPAAAASFEHRWTATTPPATARWWVRTTSRPAPMALPAASIITCRRTASPALRWPAAAPIGAWRKGLAAAAATPSRPASMAPPAPERPILPRRSITAITGCTRRGLPLPATSSAHASMRKALARALRRATTSTRRWSG